MPETRAFFYQENGEAPVKEWLERLRHQDRTGFAKCVVRLRELFQYGHELRRPAADILRDGIHELRAKAHERGDECGSYPAKPDCRGSPPSSPTDRSTHHGHAAGLPAQGLVPERP